MKKVFLCIGFVFLFMGCSTNTQSSIKSDDSQVKLYKSKVDTIPSWIMNPNKQSNICSVGSASLSDLKTSSTIALLNAKANIAKEINIYIQTKTMQTLDCNVKECKKSFDSASSQQSTQLLKGVKVIDNYTDEKNNILYVRACCKL